MRKTYRSDMKRRNDRWEYLTENLAELQKTSETSKIMFYIDRINNAIHNTQESIMSKFRHGYILIYALNDCHSLKPEQLKFKTSGLEFLK